MSVSPRVFQPLRPYRRGPFFVIPETVLAEGAFTVYLGGFAEDVALTAVRLNGILESPGRLSKNVSISEVVHPNLTHGYTLRMPFDHPFVLMEVGPLSLLFMLKMLLH